MHQLNEIVATLLREHGGGPKFFDALDGIIRMDVDIMTGLINLIKARYSSYSGGIRYTPIVSGKFGQIMVNLLPLIAPASFYSPILVNGSLCSGDPINSLDYIAYRINNRSIIFIDDSFYSGKTRDAVKAEVERLGGKFKHTFVVYDGSPNRDPEVTSVFRYYDEYSGKKLPEAEVAPEEVVPAASLALTPLPITLYKELYCATVPCRECKIVTCPPVGKLAITYDDLASKIKHILEASNIFPEILK